jgi:hypothetical protein
MTKAKKPAKFSGELAEPILAPLHVDGEDLFSDGVFEARIRKTALLAAHYGVEPGDWFGLAYRMALDLVPGFQVLYDDPRARALQSHPKTRAAVADLPVYYGNGTRPKGSGDIPEFMDGDVLIGIFAAFKESFPKENDVAIADRIILCIDDTLAGAAHETKRDKISKTLRNRLGEARRAPRFPESTPIPFLKPEEVGNPFS